MLCDLHTHSRFSDGTLTPRELVDEALSAGLSVIALTDHNTVAGLPDFFLEEGRGIELIGGVELSTDWHGTELHLVALGVSEEHYERINALVGSMRQEKERATWGLVDNLIAAGYKLDRSRIGEGAAGIINRAHVAMELVRSGYVESREEAFRTLLKKGGGYYFEPRYPDTLDVIRFVRELGLVPVLAHPLFNINADMLRELLSEATPAGLLAMEVMYSEYSEEETELAAQIADEFGLLPSGGSDFHGANKPDIAIGTGRGNLRIPLSVPQNMNLINRKGI